MLVGRVVKAHGIRGEVLIRVHSDNPSRFDPGSVLMVGNEPQSAATFRVEGLRLQRDALIVKFTSVDTRDEAERLRSALIFVGAEELAELEENAFWEHELIGLPVVDRAGRRLGYIDEIVSKGPGPAWRRFRLCNQGAGRTRTFGELRRMVAPYCFPPSRRWCSRWISRAGASSPTLRKVCSNSLNPPMRIDVVTIFPEAFVSPLQVGLLGKAIRSGILEVRIHDLRNWAPGPHRKVDEPPFGGGAGMVMTPGPVVDAAETIKQPGGRVILLTATGRRLDQALVQELSGSSQLVLVCGRYEGMDERISEVLQAEEISIGDFVLAGGEAAALVLIEAVGRLVPGLVGNPASLDEESFAGGLLEYPQYTRPQEFRGLKVPEVLLSGHHERIGRWRRQQAIRRTYLRRPYLLEQADLSEEEREKIKSWQDEEMR